MTRFCMRLVMVVLLLLQLGSAAQKPPVVQQADTELGKGNYEGALALYKDAVDHPSPEFSAWTSENKGILYNSIGACLVQLNRLDEAIPAFITAASLFQNAAPHLWLGLAYINRQNFQEASRSFQKAIGLDPNLCDGYAGLAHASSRLGQYDVAERAVESSRGKACSDNSQMDLNVSMGLVYLSKGMYDEASRVIGNSNLIGVDFYAGTGVPYIAYVFQGGPAQLAGLAVGDTIESFNGLSISSVAAFNALLMWVQFGSKVAIRINRNGASQDKYVIVGIPPNLPELAAAANRSSSGTEPARPSGKPATDSVSSAGAPALAINRVDLKPATIRPGGIFNIEVSYTATVSGQIARTFSIQDGAQTLFESKPQSVEAVVGRAGLVTISNIPSTSKPGKYTIRVRLLLGNAKAEGESVLTITQK